MSIISLNFENEIIYKLDENYDNFNERFGDEYESNKISDFKEAILFLTPEINQKEIKQWISLWKSHGKYESIIMSIGSSELVFRGYTLKLNNENNNEELLKQFYFKLEEKNQIFKDNKPSIFRVLHVDGSGECYSHNEVGIFVDPSDPVANVLIPKSSLNNNGNDNDDDDNDDNNDNNNDSKEGDEDNEASGKHDRSWSNENSEQKKKKEKKSRNNDNDEDEDEDDENNEDGDGETKDSVPLYQLNLAAAYYNHNNFDWSPISNPKEHIFIHSILTALHLEDSRDPLRTVSLN